MGVEVGRWAVVKAQLQRTADAAALGGAVEYALAQSPQAAANAAADVAALNGVAGLTPRTWNATAKMLSDGTVTVEVTAGIRTSQSTAIKVTVSQTVPLALTRLMSPTASVAVGATGWAESGGGPQPCVFASASGGAGVTVAGSASVTLTGCAVRSNASISAGNGGMSASGFYAGGTLSGDLSGTPQLSNQPAAADPYANHAGVQAAFAKLGPLGTTTVCCADGAYLLPGTWNGNWNIGGSVTLAPGIYYVNGDVTMNKQTSLSGSGVTLVLAGRFATGAGASVTLSAAQVGAAQGGAIPGVVLASKYAHATADISLGGNAAADLTGVVYVPNAPVTFGGSSHAGSSGCLQLIGASVQLQGNSGLASNCSRYGTLGIGGGAGVGLVQ